MSHRIAFLSAAALVVVALPHPAAAADYYGGGRAPEAFSGRGAEDGGWDREDVAPRPDMGPRRPRGGPGPVVFDERDPGRGFEGGFPRRGPDFDRGGPPVIGRPDFGYGPRFAGPPLGYGEGYGDRAPPRDPAPWAAAGWTAAGWAPAGRQAYGEGYGGPDVGCTVQEAQSTTPAGWRKTVTHRTCYRR